VRAPQDKRDIKKGLPKEISNSSLIGLLFEFAEA
jgi:hypothetical protein